VTHPFKPGHEEFTLLAVEGKAVLDVDLAHTTEKLQTQHGVMGKDEAIVNDLFGFNREVNVGIADLKQGVGFSGQNAHDGGVDSRGIEGSEGHDYITVLQEVGSVKRKFFLVGTVY